MRKIIWSVVSLGSFFLGFFLRGWTGTTDPDTDPEIMDPPARIDQMPGLLSSEVDQISFDLSNRVSDPVYGSSHVHDLFSPQEIDAAHDVMSDAFIKALINENPAQASVLIAGMDFDQQRQYVSPLAVSWMNADAGAGLAWLLENEPAFDDAEFLYRKSPMLVAYALQDPQAAYAYFQQTGALDDDEYLYVNLATGLAKHNFEDAFAYLRTLPDLGVSDHMLLESYSEVMGAYSEKDPLAASVVIQELDSARIQSELLEPVIDYFSQQDLGHALQWILELKNVESRTVGIEQLANDYGYQDPERIFEMVLQNQSRLSSDAVVSSFNVLADKSPQEAVKRLDELSTEFQEAAAQSLVSHWIGRNEIEALTWLHDQPDGSIFEGGAKVSAEYYSNNGTYDVALQWASLIKDPCQRFDLYSSIVNNIDITNTDEIQNMLNEVDLLDHERLSLRKTLKNRLADAHAALILPE